MLTRVKNLPQLSLADLLKRKKMTLKKFIEDSGAQTYVALVTRCDRIGVLPPTEAEYRVVMPDVVSSPSDGLIVLQPLVVDEEPIEPVVEDSEKPKRGKRKKNTDDPRE